MMLTRVATTTSTGERNVKCTCENCGREFESKRKDARYCGGNCRFTARNSERSEAAIRVNMRSVSTTSTSGYTDRDAKCPPADKTDTDRDTDRHVHCSVHPHAHKEKAVYCSGRYWCDTHKEWLSAEPCPGLRIPNVMKGLHA